MKPFKFNTFFDGWTSRVSISSPKMTLRGGDAIDSRKPPPPFDSVLDNDCDLYIEKYISGISYLDKDSFDYYLPRLVQYVLCHFLDESNVVVHDFLHEIAKEDFIKRLDQKRKESVKMLLEYLLAKNFSYKLSDILDLYQDDVTPNDGIDDVMWRG